MNANQKALIHACNELRVEYEVLHSSKNIIRLNLAKPKLFINWTVPLNDNAIAHLCKDKDYFYTCFRHVIRQPRTKAYMNPNANERFRKYLKHKTLYEILEDVQAQFSFPLVVKPNQGSWGTNVAKVGNLADLEQAVSRVFDLKSSSYDYICLVQEYIEVETELRAIFLNGKLMFAYSKDNSQAVYDGNLNPLHWQGAKACLLNNEQQKQQLTEFCTPLFEAQEIPFCGLDIAIDTQGELYLLEANSAPGFDHFIRSNGTELVINLYKQIIDALVKQCQ